MRASWSQNVSTSARAGHRAPVVRPPLEDGRDVDVAVDDGLGRVRHERGAAEPHHVGEHREREPRAFGRADVGRERMEGRLERGSLAPRAAEHQRVHRPADGRLPGNGDGGEGGERRARDQEARVGDAGPRGERRHGDERRAEGDAGRGRDRDGPRHLAEHARGDGQGEEPAEEPGEHADRGRMAVQRVRLAGSPPDERHGGARHDDDVGDHVGAGAHEERGERAAPPASRAGDVPGDRRDHHDRPAVERREVDVEAPLDVGERRRRRAERRDDVERLARAVTAAEAPPAPRDDRQTIAGRSAIPAAASWGVSMRVTDDRA
jgi:hypothetical protein